VPCVNVPDFYMTMLECTKPMLSSASMPPRVSCVTGCAVTDDPPPARNADKILSPDLIGLRLVHPRQVTLSQVRGESRGREHRCWRPTEAPAPAGRAVGLDRPHGARTQVPAPPAGTAGLRCPGDRLPGRSVPGSTQAGRTPTARKVANTRWRTAGSRVWLHPWTLIGSIFTWSRTLPERR
jgi:hypothetical protein